MRRNSCNGMSILGQLNNTVFIRLPLNISVEILGGCQCPYCEAHPDIPPRWDMLCVPFDTGESLGGDHTWTIHMPEVMPSIRAAARNRRVR